MFSFDVIGHYTIYMLYVILYKFWKHLLLRAVETIAGTTSTFSSCYLSSIRPLDVLVMLAKSDSNTKQRKNSYHCTSCVTMSLGSLAWGIISINLFFCRIAISAPCK